jgi:hypothetical protein
MKINVSGSSAQIEGPGGRVLYAQLAKVYRTPSESRQGKFHFTILDLTSHDPKYPMCTCEGYQYRGKCKHADGVWKAHANEAPVVSVEDKDGLAKEQ